MRVAVLGAGMVGTCCALALQARGAEVTLIDRRAPGEETSHGNAGVIARSSLIPFNHPRLWRALPALLRNKSPGFRYDARYLLNNAAWGARFLAHARHAEFARTTQSLDHLVTLSIAGHRRLRDEANVASRYRDDGWIFCYRNQASFNAAAWQRKVFDTFNVRYEALDANALQTVEPHLAKNTFARALWVKDAMSVDDPGAVVKAFAQLFVERGGRFVQTEIPAAQKADFSKLIFLKNVGNFDKVLVALGPWSPDYLAPLGINVPMAYERGCHQQFYFQNGATLNHPFYDVEAGYVLAPMSGGARLTTGVELAHRDAPVNVSQLTLATRVAQSIIPIAVSPRELPWLGSRPTLPDSRPVIGPSSRIPNLWLAFGHQHIGFSTGPGTAAMLTDLMFNARTHTGAEREDSVLFSPARFGL